MAGRTMKRRNPSVDDKAKASKKPQENQFEQYTCTSCGTKHGVQKNNFYVLTSPLYKANNNFSPVCKRCMDDLYEYYVKYWNDEYLALRTIAQRFDIYFTDKIYGNVRRSGATKSKVGELIRLTKLAPYSGRGYDEAVKEQMEREKEEARALEASRALDLTPEVRQRWGSDYTDEECRILEEHYATLHGRVREDDPIQEKLVRDLCDINLQQVICRRNGNFDGYEKLTKLYQATMKNADLKVNSQAGDVNDASQCFGVWVEQLENYVPAEVYVHETLFDDVDGIRAYFERFILRPMKNFFMGTNEMDTEYSVNVGEDGGGAGG